MKDSNYDVLLLRPQDIADVIDIERAIDLLSRAIARPSARPGGSSWKNDCQCSRKGLAAGCSPRPEPWPSAMAAGFSGEHLSPPATNPIRTTIQLVRSRKGSTTPSLFRQQRSEAARPRSVSASLPRPLHRAIRELATDALGRVDIGAASATLHQADL
jgi:hypothetical protein